MEGCCKVLLNIVIHLDNYMFSNNYDLLDYTRNKSMFIELGYVNKFRSNDGNLQPDVLMNLFKSYCFLYMAQYFCDFCSKWFNKICNFCNVSIRTLLNLPSNAHPIYLDSLINNFHLIKYLYLRNFRFYGMFLDQTTVFYGEA